MRRHFSLETHSVVGSIGQGAQPLAYTPALRSWVQPGLLCLAARKARWKCTAPNPKARIPGSLSARPGHQNLHSMLGVPYWGAYYKGILLLVS